MGWVLFLDTHMFSFGTIVVCSNIINHFGCEYSAIISASCSDTYFNLMLSFIISTVNEACSFLTNLSSYLFIIVMIIKMSFAGGLWKAFSTCAPHLITITILHGTFLLLYCVPISKRSFVFIKIASVFYTVVMPMLNSVIYSLRNNIKVSIRKLINAEQRFSH